MERLIKKKLLTWQSNLSLAIGKHIMQNELCMELIEKIYQEQKELAREELDLNCKTGYEGEWSEKELHNLAVEWTLDDVTQMVNSYLDQKWAHRQDSINKNFFG